MANADARITYDRRGTPGVWAMSPPQAYWGMGLAHGLHRPLQTLLLHTAARGRLSGCLLPRNELVETDTLVHRLDLPARGRRESTRLSSRGRQWLDAYLDGIAAGIDRRCRSVLWR
ncbi:MAG: penicillin acylase family protein [Myxococcota bacterium]